MSNLSRTPLAILLIGALSGPVQAADAPTAAEVVDRAIRAHGGADRLARLNNLIRTATGELANPGGALPFTGELILRLPEQGRWTFEFPPQAGGLRVVVGVNRARGWQSRGGKVMDLSDNQRGEFQNEIYLMRLMTLLPLRDRTVAVTTLPGKGDSAEVGLLVTSRGRPDVRLYFDARTHLLTRAERKGHDAGVEVDKVYYLGGYKVFEGVQLPTRIVELMNGSKVVDLTVSDYRMPPRINEGIFEKSE